jgi:hypothetical protein
MILEGRKMIPSAFLPSTGSGQAKQVMISFLVFRCAWNASINDYCGNLELF